MKDSISIEASAEPSLPAVAGRGIGGEKEDGRLTNIVCVGVICAAVAIVIGISAHAPSTTYAYAQIQQIGAAVGTLESGNWLLPRDQLGGLARKPQLKTWLDAMLLSMTGMYDDFTFRVPNVLAAFGTAVLVYSLGVRWYNRKVGVLSALLWATAMHMSKMMYLAVTDMMQAFFIIAAISCVDRLLFHSEGLTRRRLWVVGLWMLMILGAMTKGWGVVNLILVGGMTALATALSGGFAEAGERRGVGSKIAGVAGLIAGRWRQAARAVGLWWGLAAMAAVLGPVWVGMFMQGGAEFWEIVHYEFVLRITGSGAEHVPHSSSVPAVVHLVYYTMPVSIFALMALILVPPKRWFRSDSAVFLPLCWIVAVVGAFAAAHGFRPDYLLPCYAAVALMAGWAVDALARQGGISVRNQMLRHAAAAVPVVIGVLLIAAPAIYLWHESMPSAIRKNMSMPRWVSGETWWILRGLMLLGAVVVIAAVRASLRWQVRRVALAAVAGMLGVLFLNSHFFTRHARTGDGEHLRQFSLTARAIVGDSPVAVYKAEKLAVELYLGRFGERLVDVPADELAMRLNEMDAPYLITCDRGLVEFGAARQDEEGTYRATLTGREGKFEFATLPEELGEVLAESRPIISQNWGRVYLLRLQRPVAVSGKPQMVAYHPGRQDEEEED